ncbi:MAG TPA: carbamoyltransferase C-terminal domain-containing protein, partial [Thermoanaerobaculia bacterium]|nr:carbamoyltransferase C-terminal domain-containing protein [Thermoanaerobaculia bacterium]
LHQPRTFVMDHAYWGPEYDDEAVDRAVEARRGDLETAHCRRERVTDERELCRRTAASIANGDVVGWFQGRVEFGPRALGNRSIVCDPRRADMKNILNQKIKRRESFRPFAPSILREAVGEWFETDYDVPFMLQVYQIREEKRTQIPAVTHVNGSGRLQSVERSQNARYYALIEAFREATGVPIVLNTSFNENEPVVNTPSEALDCFLRTKMDLLVMGDLMISRPA